MSKLIQKTIINLNLKTFITPQQCYYIINNLKSNAIINQNKCRINGYQRARTRHRSRSIDHYPHVE